MELRIRIKWQILFRVAFLMAMVVSGTVLRLFYAETVPESFLTLLLSGFGYSVISFLVLRVSSDRFLKSVAWSQVLWDVLYTSFLISLPGGLQSVFTMLYVLQILAAAGVLSSYGALGAAIGSILGLLAVIAHQNGLSIFAQSAVVPKIILLVSTLALVGGAVAQFFRSRETLAKSLERTSSDLKDLGHLYSAIVDHIPSGIIYLDASQQVKLLNQAALRILGESWVGRMMPGSLLQTFLKSEGRFESELEIGVTRKILGHHLTHLPDGGAVIVFQDVTEIRDLEKKMVLKDKLAGIGQLAAGIAHEIRNPLASLSGSIQLLKTELKLEPNYEKLMRIVLRETDRLDHLANSFLNYAKPSELRLEEIPVSKTMDEVLTLLKNSNDLSSGRIRLKAEIPDSLFCICDPRQLKQILWNLVTNAVQAIPEKGEISVSAEDSNFQGRPAIRFVIKDSGEGMTDEVKARIFDPFFTTKVSGSGLGLALVYQMIKAHQGRLGVESKLGVGTTFWFEFLKRGPQLGDIEEKSSASAA